MGYETDIPQALAAFGLPFEYTAGWSTAGSSSFAPRGVVDHWTAGPRDSRSRPSLNVVKHGRPGLPGPLCNVYLDRYGKSVIVAAGRANHAGAGGWKGLTGNSSVFGIEAESAGDGDWTREQQEAYPRLNAALLSLTPNAGNPDYVCGHNEWAPTRKIDIRDWPMAAMRAQTLAVLQGDDDMPLDAQRDYEAFKQMQWRYDKFDSRPGAPAPDWTQGPTTFEHLSMILAEVRGLGSIAADADPAEIAKAVVDAIPADIAKDVVAEMGAQLAKAQATS